MDIRPNCTIYINNLNDKIAKPELKRSLFELFSQFGSILDIVAMKTMKMRGQAFIVFKEISIANVAMRTLNGFLFYGRKMKIHYAKGESEVVGRVKGTYVEKNKKTKKNEMDGKKKEKMTTGQNGHVEGVQETEGRKVQKDTGGGIEGGSNILFVSNMPHETTKPMLSMLFNQFPGAKDIRQVPGRADIAFVEFDSTSHATNAMETLQGFKIDPTHSIKIEYSKK